MTVIQNITSAELCASNPDADLLAMIARHDQLWEITEAEAPNPPGIIRELCDLELTIAATPAFTVQGLDSKRRVVDRAEFDDADGIIDEILRLDAERVAG